jgi:ATP-dependent DNA helicase DinG
MRNHLEIGIETEFRAKLGKTSREAAALWPKLSAPPVCPARLCPHYHDCFYYKARREAEEAKVVITNHSVVLQDAILARASDQGQSLLGDYDYLILDEAHDFPEAAANGLEYELSAPKLQLLAGISHRIQSGLSQAAARLDEVFVLEEICERFRRSLENVSRGLAALSLQLPHGGILEVAPIELSDHPHVKRASLSEHRAGAADVALHLSDVCGEFLRELHDLFEDWREKEASETLRFGMETVRPYLGFIREHALGAARMFEPEGVAVTYAGSGREPFLRQDQISLQNPLRELLWSRVPSASVSATLALDGVFDFYKRTTGLEPRFEEVLPSPFDFARQAALYLPPAGRIPDPTAARQEGSEERYYAALAAELSEIIRLMEGRTLALFHSRKEMEGVLKYMDVPADLPILMQFKSGAAGVGERFKAHRETSLFALRSFWTGFDAPGETCSCVALVRVPFEVPVDPPQIARMAWLQSQGLDPFFAHTLPMAKMLMRQGAGRLIRRDEDKGLIALLDPRLTSKRYGEQILANLPQEMRRFSDVADAIGWLGL